jgi:hypothetical protein
VNHVADAAPTPRSRNVARNVAKPRMIFESGSWPRG